MILWLHTQSKDFDDHLGLVFELLTLLSHLPQFYSHSVPATLHFYLILEHSMHAPISKPLHFLSFLCRKCLYSKYSQGFILYLFQNFAQMFLAVLLNLSLQTS